MILDSSAVVAVVLSEPGSEELLRQMRAADALGIGAPTLAETLIVLARRLGGDPSRRLRELLMELDVDVTPFGEEHSYAALKAYLRYGKGRHPAALNLGDCLTYAAASIADEKLLFMGDDFSKADLVSR
jgi:ribonuclease VapC